MTRPVPAALARRGLARIEAEAPAGQRVALDGRAFVRLFRPELERLGAPVPARGDKRRG